MAPPLAEMRMIPDVPALSRMTPSRFHVPAPRRTEQPNRVAGAPPVSAIFFSLLFSINPMNRLSGDQNGVPISPTSASGVAVAEFSGRAQRCVFPSTVATKASVRPSGEIAGRSKRVAFSGGFTNKRIGTASGAGRRKYAMPNVSEISASAPRSDERRRSRQPLRFDQAEASGPGAISVRLASDEPGSDKASSANRKSPAD